MAEGIIIMQKKNTQRMSFVSQSAFFKFIYSTLFIITENLHNKIIAHAYGKNPNVFALKKNLLAQAISSTI